jgi:hypothetical protein
VKRKRKKYTPAALSSRMSYKREMFAVAYAETLDATESARRAGYSRNSASVSGSKLMADPIVQHRVAVLRKDIERKLRVSAEKVLGAIADIGFADESEVKVASRLDALKILGDHLGLWKQRFELTGQNGGPVNVRNLTDDQLLNMINVTPEPS